METVVVAFENLAMCQRFGDLLESTGTARYLACHSGGQVRRILNQQQIYCVICGPRLTDGPAEWLFKDMPPACSLLLVGPQHVLDACASGEVFKLSTPIRKEEAVTTVRLLIQFGHRTEKLLRPRRSLAEREVVDRAKRLLMDCKGMTEEEAHHALQKRSMDGGCRLVQTARQVVSELEAI